MLPAAGARGRLAQICQDAAVPGVQGRFWVRAGGWSIVDEGDRGVRLDSAAGNGPTLVMGPPVAPEAGRNRLRLALAPGVGSDPSAEVGRLLDAGASSVDTAMDAPGWRLLADPEGNEFLVREPGAMSSAGRVLASRRR
ncbi:VOC family protein [Kitasatospora sp. NBC_01287]|uniref:VOC family protein n=1 Tax=Kitasatospora sp. NBC_01287 TaxID=2903573 RepID=UPI00225900D1|nr:VOC family protein [Kitasatospora sp. NBC_01287]MCX4744020.1 VOC family protein [Kitasatospora sp. NBC_01287]